MKYENIDRLIRSLETFISELGYCWMTPKNNGSTQDGVVFEHLNEQKGVIRTNCMDCLDRTNVVQSAIGRYILNHQLLRLGIASFPDKGLSVYEDFENIFNNVWANNGDAISREYAGTSALKGDFTRTGKRNLQGMINDATNSMARMYQNTFKDYFRQAAIDYLLGAADMTVFKSLQTTLIGTAVVPDPALVPPGTTLQIVPAPALIQSSLLPIPGTDQSVAGESVDTGVLLPSLLPPSSTSSEPLPLATVEALSESREDIALPQETWLKIREAAIETSAEIIISPGEKQWKGWTFICCTNEINSSLTSASPQSRSAALGMKPSPLSAPTTGAKSSSQNIPAFYEEKVILLTERALYICTYDYEMEKVLEFWRLALEKVTGIDKGAFFLTAQDTSRQGQDPLENYGFAVIYKASSEGEMLRVNRGSVRNRRRMGVNRVLADEAFNLEHVPEADEDNDTAVESRQSCDTSTSRANSREDGSIAKSQPATEPSRLRSVRFKIVKHPETSMVPYASSSEVDSTEHEVNPTRYRRTAQDCVEWVVTEIVQARCELISMAENEDVNGTLDKRLTDKKDHGRSSSEEYNYQTPQGPCHSSVQVDMVIQDRVLQSLEVAAQLEKDALKRDRERAKKSRKPFSGLFFSSRPAGTPPFPNNNVSWLKRFQFGNDTDSETEDEEALAEEDHVPVAAADKADNSAGDGQPTVKASQDRAGDTKNRNSVFAKFKQAIKNF